MSFTRGSLPICMNRLATGVLLVALVACGAQPRAAQPTIRPSGVVVTDFLTAIEAIRLATQSVPGASGLFSVSVSFPRSQGKSEFWTIDLAHPSDPASISRVQIQGRRVVTTSEAPIPDGARAVPADQVKIDSSEAITRVSALSWFKPGDEVTLAPEVLRVGSDLIAAARDRAFWHLIVVSPAPERTLRGAAWIATDTGEVLFECHPPEVSC